ncbi:type IV secretory system conjugative DNA transfer family protein [Clostridium sp.]|uniref:type IV secretory system conjugative DNA transfer family protein n=1 Tax=Clostridium sp. TaxID=1506 RepID=UPI00399561F1
MINPIFFLSSCLGVSQTLIASTIGLATGYMAISKLSEIKKNKLESDDKNTFSEIKDIEKFLGNNGIKLSTNVNLSAKALEEHLIILGPTGCGKTSSLFIPNLLSRERFNNSNSSLVLTDPKGELHSITSSYQRTLGREIKVFSPYSPLRSIHYNPLDFCNDESEVIGLARDILVTGAKAIELRTNGNSPKDTIWINMATPLFASALLYCWKLKRPQNTISNALRLIIDNSDIELNNLLGEHEDDNIRLQYKMYEKAATSPATAGSIQVTLTSNAQSFLTPVIEDITAYSDFTFKDLRKNKTALYLIYDFEKAPDLAPLTAIFYSQLFSECKKYNRKHDLNIYCLFDEFANIGAIPNFNIYSSTLRSYRISLICALQDKNQLKNLYGTGADTIFNNLKHLVLFGGNKDNETLQSISKLAGVINIKNITKSINSSGTTTSESFRTKNLLNISDLKNINEDEILIMLKNSKPLLDNQNKYYKNFEYLSKC